MRTAGVVHVDLRVDRLLGDGRIRPLPARPDGLRLYETIHPPRGRRRLPAHLRPLLRDAIRRTVRQRSGR
ncbi:MAG TPA: hypothetical protein VFR97_02295 [Capillimicrobium sp.]|nr:hypothetical protein [Capillimicrobium sp.]